MHVAVSKCLLFFDRWQHPHQALSRYVNTDCLVTHFAFFLQALLTSKVHTVFQVSYNSFIAKSNEYLNYKKNRPNVEESVTKFEFSALETIRATLGSRELLAQLCSHFNCGGERESLLGGERESIGCKTREEIEMLLLPVNSST